MPAILRPAATFKLKSTEELLCEVVLPRAWRTQAQAPRYERLLVSSHRLILDGKESGQGSFWYSKLKTINYGRIKGGFGRIVIKQRWNSIYLDGFFGTVERKLVEALNVAARYLPQT